jgi:hypothetical protein
MSSASASSRLAARDARAESMSASPDIITGSETARLGLIVVEPRHGIATIMPWS